MDIKKVKAIEIKNHQASHIEELDDLEVATIVGGARIKGQVKLFNENKGFGFITPADGSKDVFVDFSAIQGNGSQTLAEGQNIQFDVKDGPKGGIAANVIPI
ncbi:cold shock domain-containing protein [uncultured Nostoc sp.]|uniref:cold shock domain-containing protein n=1 Tax=uncultured Nostoc sp. TaxID=340711 RepID=UPI0035CBF4CF